MKRWIMVALVALPSLATAQRDFVTIGSGTRVRVAIPDSARQGWGVPRELWLRGTVTGVSGDTMRIRIPSTGGVLAIARADMRRLDRSLGVPSRGASAAQGLIGGAAFGALGGLLLSWTGIGEFDDRSAGESSLIVGGIGAATGLMFGALQPVERWRRIRLR
jgi:hypothetical protein